MEEQVLPIAGNVGMLIVASDLQSREEQVEEMGTKKRQK